MELHGALAELKALSHDAADELHGLGCDCSCKKFELNRQRNKSGKCYCRGCRKCDPERSSKGK